MYCRNCGKKLEEDARFCSGCGYSVSAVVVPMPHKAAHGGIKAGIMIAVGAVVLCFCLFIFTRMGSGDEAGQEGDDSLEASAAIEEDTGGSKADGVAGGVEPQKESAGCDSYTIGETSAVSQWILENWGVDGIGQCDFIELISDDGMCLIVKKSGINDDYAAFVVDDGGSDVEILGKYEFAEQISGIYCGTNGEGLDFYRMYIDDRGIDWGICAINEMGKIECVFTSGVFQNVSYGENGKQESVQIGLLTTDEERLLKEIRSGHVPSQCSYQFEDVQATFQYEYNPIADRIEAVHIDIQAPHYEYDSITTEAEVAAAAAGWVREYDYSFRYLELADTVSLEGVTCQLTGMEEGNSFEQTAWINYNRDDSGNLISFEIGHD